MKKFLYAHIFGLIILSYASFAGKNEFSTNSLNNDKLEYSYKNENSSTEDEIIEPVLKKSKAFEEEINNNDEQSTINEETSDMIYIKDFILNPTGYVWIKDNRRSEINKQNKKRKKIPKAEQKNDTTYKMSFDYILNNNTNFYTNTFNTKSNKKIKKLSNEEKDEMITEFYDYAKKKLEHIKDVYQLAILEKQQLFDNIAKKIQQNSTMTRGEKNYSGLTTFLRRFRESTKKEDPREKTIHELQKAFNRLYTIEKRTQN